MKKWRTHRARGKGSFLWAGGWGLDIGSAALPLHRADHVGKAGYRSFQSDRSSVYGEDPTHLLAKSRIKVFNKVWSKWVIHVYFEVNELVIWLICEYKIANVINYTWMRPWKWYSCHSDWKCRGWVRGIRQLLEGFPVRRWWLITVTKLNHFYNQFY